MHACYTHLTEYKAILLTCLLCAKEFLLTHVLLANLQPLWHIMEFFMARTSKIR